MFGRFALDSKEFKDFRFTEVELVGKNTFRFKGKFCTNYSEDDGSFEFGRVYIDPASLYMNDNWEGGLTARVLATDKGEFMSLYDVPPEPPLELTMEEIEKRYGRKVKIVSK